MTVLDRGYTSHEHFAMIGIIHMNGRLYDPTLRRFLNADENIQDMFNTQNYNKYGYVMNNPLMYNDPNGELFFAFLGVWAFWQAVIIGAAIGLASYTVGLAVTGNIGMWSLGGALRATLFGAVSGGATYGIGSIFTAATKTFGNALLQAGAHSVSQGVLRMMQGQNFLSSVIGGMVGSLAASGWSAMMNGVGLGQFSQSVYGMVTFSALSGGVGAELAGGNFWKGAVAGGIVAGLNHAMHKLTEPGKGTNDWLGDGGNVEYDGKAYWGSNYIGPGPDIDPYELLKSGLKPLDMVDKAAFMHDVEYYKARTGGIKGALLDTAITYADMSLEAAAKEVMNGYKKGAIDPVTGVKISKRTYNMARLVNAGFATINTHKLFRININTNINGFYNSVLNGIMRYK